MSKTGNTKVEISNDISKPDNKVKIGISNVYQQLDDKIKDRTMKCISAELTVRSRSDYQMYISKSDSKIKDRTFKCISANLTITLKIEISNLYQQS